MPLTEAQLFTANQRIYQHRHNGLMGSNRMMLQHLRNIQSSASCTERAKQLANQIEGLAIELADEIYTYRVEPNGFKRLMEHNSSKD